jgi:spore coat polysaccharide biosynthesis predicted glycosyltransferase SpsG
MPRRSIHKTPRCVFRFAAGPRIGFGHLMRARALAACLDVDVAVSVRGGQAAREAARMIGPIVDGAEALRSADVLILDDPSPAQGRRWVARARRAGIRSVSVHDDARTHAADLVICGSLGTPRPATAAALLHGTRFYLLDRQIAGLRAGRGRVPAAFAALPAHPMPRPRILVALGGGQHVRRIAQPLVNAIVRRRPDVEVIVAAGFSGRARPPLDGAVWLSSRSGLAQALAASDVAVVAGGVTLYEACALGVPSVGLAVVPGQRHAIRACSKAGALLDAGDISSQPRALAAAAAGVSRLLGDRALRTRTSAAARRLVDGQGAERVARHVHALLGRDARG